MFGMTGFESASIRSQLAGWLLISGAFFLPFGVGWFLYDPDPNEPANLKKMLYGCYINEQAPAFEIAPNEIKVFVSPPFVSSYRLEPRKKGWQLFGEPSLQPKYLASSRTFTIERGGGLYMMRLVKAGRYRPQPARGTQDWTGMIELSGLIFQKARTRKQCEERI